MKRMLVEKYGVYATTVLIFATVFLEKNTKFNFTTVDFGDVKCRNTTWHQSLSCIKIGIQESSVVVLDARQTCG